MEEEDLALPLTIEVQSMKASKDFFPYKSSNALGSKPDAKLLTEKASLVETLNNCSEASSCEKLKQNNYFKMSSQNNICDNVVDCEKRKEETPVPKMRQGCPSYRPPSPTLPPRACAYPMVKVIQAGTSSLKTAEQPSTEWEREPMVHEQSCYSAQKELQSLTDKHVYDVRTVMNDLKVLIDQVANTSDTMKMSSTQSGMGLSTTPDTGSLRPETSSDVIRRTINDIIESEYVQMTQASFRHSSISTHPPRVTRCSRTELVQDHHMQSQTAIGDNLRRAGEPKAGCQRALSKLQRLTDRYVHDVQQVMDIFWVRVNEAETHSYLSMGPAPNVTVESNSSVRSEDSIETTLYQPAATAVAATVVESEPTKGSSRSMDASPTDVDMGIIPRSDSEIAPRVPTPKPVGSEATSLNGSETNSSCDPSEMIQSKSPQKPFKRRTTDRKGCPF